MNLMHNFSWGTYMTKGIPKVRELARETNTYNEQAKWIFGGLSHLLCM